MDQNRPHDENRPLQASGDAGPADPAETPRRDATPGDVPPDGAGRREAGPADATPAYADRGRDSAGGPELTHRYDAGDEHTRAYDTRGWGGPSGADGPGTSAWGGPGGPFHATPTGHHVGPEPRKRRSGLAAAVLAGALVLGGLAGFGGAAGYDALNGDTESSSTRDAGTTSSVVQREDTPAPSGSVEDVANSVLPSVVKINVRGPQGQGSGSGVVISADGEILTNNHVVEVAAQGGSVSVGFNDGTTAAAEVVGTDPLTDLAIIKAQGVSGLTPATLGQSGNLDVGEQVVAIGSPFGLEATVTSGIVSALNRPVSVSDQGSAMSTTYPAIQTDAAINPGNSGGPLVNMQGEVVGINSSIRTASSASGPGGSIGLGFAIPLDEVLPIVDQLRNGETPTHARLGVSVTDASSEDGLLTGAGVTAVEPGSAADDAGLKVGDVVVKVGDHQITDASSLVATVRGHRPDDKVTLTVSRNDEQLQLQATLDSDEGQPLS